jgi:hypothetical protein
MLVDKANTGKQLTALSFPTDQMVTKEMSQLRKPYTLDRYSLYSDTIRVSEKSLLELPD